jgi:multidrug efflux pump
MFTHFFIDRPILSSVISILIVLARPGLALRRADRAVPDMAPPQVQVRRAIRAPPPRSSPTPWPRPSRRRSTAIDNLLYFNSVSSSSGNVTISVVFRPGATPTSTR